MKANHGMESEIKPFLNQGEKLLWSGKPKAGIEFIEDVRNFNDQLIALKKIMLSLVKINNLTINS